VIARRLDSAMPAGYDASIPEMNVTLDTTANRSLAHAGTNPALTAALAIAGIAAATLAGAWFFELVLDIQPCPLCLEQRYAYYLAVPLGALVAFAAGKDAPRAVLVAGLGLLALAALGNAGLGTYHAGVEWHFWQGPTDCSGPVVDLGSAGNLLERLDTVKVIRCDEVQWRFLGLSLAGYNVLISLLMAAIAAWGIAGLRRRVT
jgi:disulfide bond formation protein DsbB